MTPMSSGINYPASGDALVPGCPLTGTDYVNQATDFLRDLTARFRGVQAANSAPSNVEVALGRAEEDHSVVLFDVFTSYFAGMPLGGDEDDTAVTFYSENFHIRMDALFLSDNPNDGVRVFFKHTPITPVVVHTPVVLEWDDPREQFDAVDGFFYRQDEARFRVTEAMRAAFAAYTEGLVDPWSVHEYRPSEVSTSTPEGMSALQRIVCLPAAATAVVVPFSPEQMENFMRYLVAEPVGDLLFTRVESYPQQGLLFVEATPTPDYE